MKQQSSVLSPLLTGVLIGFCCSSIGFLALWPAIPKPSQVPPITMIVEAKNIDAGGMVVPQGGSPPIKKLYTDRIAPGLAAISEEKRALASRERSIGPKARPARDNIPCKPGRTRNHEGQCGRWESKAVPVKLQAQKEHVRSAPDGSVHDFRAGQK